MSTTWTGNCRQFATYCTGSCRNGDDWTGSRRAGDVMNRFSSRSSDALDRKLSSLRQFVSGSYGIRDVLERKPWDLCRLRPEVLELATTEPEDIRPARTSSSSSSSSSFYLPNSMHVYISTVEKSRQDGEVLERKSSRTSTRRSYMDDAAVGRALSRRRFRSHAGDQNRLGLCRSRDDDDDDVTSCFRSSASGSWRVRCVPRRSVVALSATGASESVFSPASGVASASSFNSGLNSCMQRTPYNDRRKHSRRLRYRLPKVV